MFFKEEEGVALYPLSAKHLGMYKSWLTSSMSPDEVSNTVKGIVLGASSIIVYVVAHFFKMQISVEDVSSLATGFGLIAGSIWGVWGIIMKITVKAGSV